MSNKYGLEFLRAEHRDSATADDAPTAWQPTETDSTTKGETTQAFLRHNNNDEEHLRLMAAAVAHKSDLEKQFLVIGFLQAHRSAGCLAPNVIYKATGIDLEEVDETVAIMLQRNPKIRVEQVPDPENPSIMLATYAYQAKYNNVRDVKTLLAQINRCKNGVPMRDLVDAYDGVETDLAMLITAGDVLAIANSEDKDKILFPRGDAFLVELDGIVALKESATSTSSSSSKEGGGGDDTTTPPVVPTVNTNKDIYIVNTDVDPRKQVRRGEAINVGGQWFRVSSAVREGVPLSEQPVRAQAPLSVVSLLDLSKRNEQDGYIRPLSKKYIPLDAPLKTGSIQNILNAKAARDKLHKLAHNINGARSGMSTAAQLLSSNAHASNPTVLAQSFAMAAQAGNAGGAGGGNSSSATNTVVVGGGRKRPNIKSSSDNGTGGDGSSNNPNSNSAAAKLKRREAVQAQQEAASDPALSLYSHARRHGCTKDVRDMYLAMKDIPESDFDLQRLLVQNGLLEPGEMMRRPRLAKRANVDNDGKPKKRRYYERKNQRMTNTHLEGTEIGAVLRRAQEMQQQGKSVGDGGM